MTDSPHSYTYPTDTSEEEWAFAAPYLTLLPQTAGQRRHDLRAVYDALRWIVRAGAPWRMLPMICARCCAWPRGTRLSPVP
jgi:transposase